MIRQSRYLFFRFRRGHTRHGPLSEIAFQKVMQASFIPGSLKFLQLPKKENKCCFIITGTPEQEMRSIVKRKELDRYFDQVKGSPQDKKEILKELIKQYQIDPARAIFFGDSITDLEAARSQNVRFVGINYPDLGESILGYENFSALLGGNGR